MNARANYQRGDASKQIRVLPQLISMIWFTFVGLAVVYGLAGRTMLEKTLTVLATPCGFVWLMLIAVGWWLWRINRKGTTLVLALAWITLTLGGNSWVTHALVNQLEAPWRHIEVLQRDPLDVVVVLGGGTSERSPGRAQLSDDGERVVTAARMYHAGKTQRIICTGTQAFRADPTDLHYREEAAQILLGLNIPADRVEQIEGVNTTEEIKNLRVWINQQRDPNIRIGIITSAYHLSRAMRLVQSHGIVAEPIPANFITYKVAPSPSWVIPHARNLASTGAALKEYLAGLIGR